MALITSVATGLWSATTTWDTGTVPIQGDRVIISLGHTVTIDTNAICGNDVFVNMSYNPEGSADTNFQLVIDGVLKFSRTVSATMAVHGTTAIKGTLDMGTLIDPIPSNITAGWYLNPGVINQYGYFYNIVSKQGGTLSAVSADKRVRNTVLTASSLAGSNTITVADITGWKVGDELLLAPQWIPGKYTQNGTGAKDYDRLIIQSIDTVNNIVTFTTNMVYNHGAVDPLDLDLAAVSNLTSNVKFIGNQSYSMGLSLFKSFVTLDNVLFSKTCNFYNAHTGLKINGSSSTNSSPLHCKGLVFDSDGTLVANHTRDVFSNYISSESFIEDLVFVQATNSAYKGLGYQVNNSYGGVSVTLNKVNMYCITPGSYIYGVNNYQQPNTITNFTLFNAVVCFRGYATIDNIVKDCKAVYSNYLTQGISSTMVCEGIKARGLYALALGSANFRHNITHNFLDVTNGVRADKIMFSIPYTDRFNWLSTNHNKDPKQHRLIDINGTFERDLINTTKLASIKAINTSNAVPNKLLKYEQLKIVGSGTTLTASVDVLKDATYNGVSNPKIVLTSVDGTFTTTGTAPAGTWETLTVTHPITTSSTKIVITVEFDGTLGFTNFENLIIDNTKIDLGRDIFPGGIENSTLIDITDNSVPVNIKVVDNVNNPIDGAIVYLTDNSNNVLLEAYTDIQGIASGSFTYTADILSTLKIRRGTNPIYYKPHKSSILIKKQGIDLTITLIKDQ